MWQRFTILFIVNRLVNTLFICATVLVAIGAGIVAGTAAAYVFTTVIMSNAWNPVGWIVAALGALVVLWGFLLPDYEDVIVEFECKPWVAPDSGNDCEKCNNRESTRLDLLGLYT